MRTAIVATAGDFARIAPAWAALFAKVPDAPPFASPAWLVPWWGVFAPGRLAAAAVWRGETLVGFAPTYVEHGSHGRRLLPLGIGLSDHLDVLLDPDCAVEAGAAMAEAIGATRGDWDIWSAEDLRPGAAALSLPEPPGCASALDLQSLSPVLALPGPDGSLEDVIPSGKRRKWRMAQHRVARRDWRIVPTTAATLAEDLEHLFRLHGARWDSRGETGVLSDARVRAFHRAAAPGLLAAGLLQLSTLRIDDAVAGAYYGLARPGAHHAYLGGFDPGFGFESPGTLLVGAAIAAAHAAGAAAFHFLRGPEGYKYEWGATDMWTQCRRVRPL